MRIINFDHISCSSLLPEVKEVVEEFIEESIGNPLSKHRMGERAKKILNQSREYIADLINSNPDEIIFTSCGSESNNLAVKGIAFAYQQKGKHIISTPIEHHSILHPLKTLERQGYEISYVSVDSSGIVNIDQIKSLIRKDTILITITTASNEIGTVEPISEIGKIARENNIIFHTDAVCACGFLNIDVKEMNIDLLSISGNIFYGPLGTGALYIRKGIKILPLIEGGIQERGLRAGTHNIAGIAGMGIAAKIAKEKMNERNEYLLVLREKLIEGILKEIPDTFITGHRTNRLPYHASFCFKFIEGESILLNLDFSGICAISGSTCSSEALKVSHVLEAIGVPAHWAQGSVAFTLGIDNSPEDIDLLIENLKEIVKRLREISPFKTEEDFIKFKKEL